MEFVWYIIFNFVGMDNMSIELYKNNKKIRIRGIKGIVF